MQAIGDTVSYLNSVVVTSQLFFVPATPEINVEGFNDKTDTGRIYLKYPKYETATYIIMYQYLNSTDYESNSSFNNIAIVYDKISVNYNKTNNTMEFDANNNNIYFDGTYLYYTFLNAGYYKASVVCYVSGLPSKESDSVFVRFNFFESGSGTEESPFAIVNLDQFNAIFYRPYAYYILGDDFTINTEYKLPNLDFHGTVNGSDKTITIQYEVYSLFNSLSETAKIQNLNIVVDYSYSDAGKELYLITKTNSGIIQNVTVTINKNINLLKFAMVETNNNEIVKVNLKGDSTVTLGNDANTEASGSAICITNNKSVANCSNNINIKSGNTNSNIIVGGIVVLNNGTITKCYNSGTLKGAVVGGICAENSNNISYCYNTGKNYYSYRRWEPFYYYAVIYFWSRRIYDWSFR